MGQRAGRLPRKTHAGSMPSINGVSVCFSALTGITLSPTMKFDAIPTNVTEIIQARRLTLFGHITQMDDNLDAKQILTSSPAVYRKKPPGRQRMTGMKTVQNDLNSLGLSWTDAVDLTQNRPLWRLLATSGATHS